MKTQLFFIILATLTLICFLSQTPIAAEAVRTKSVKAFEVAKCNAPECFDDLALPPNQI
jgi:hypothetical protein